MAKDTKQQVPAPKRQGATPKSSMQASPLSKTAQKPKTGLGVAVKQGAVSLKSYFAKANGYETIAMALFGSVLLIVLFARPEHGQLPTALRLLALVTAMAAKFMSNSGLSANPGTSADQATLKRLSLLLDGVAVLFTTVSFFV